jgi:uncharacterized protein YjbJ (UPF0337 family)
VTTTTLASNPQIASDALNYEGHSYTYGGVPGTSGKNGWDCSSFCNWVIGHDLGGAIPGFAAGSYSGATHGPNTLSWLTTSLATGISQSQLQPGDLIVWQTHMGICIGNSNMISALNAQMATAVTTISGGAPIGEIAFYRRYKSSLGAQAQTASDVQTDSVVSSAAGDVFLGVLSAFGITPTSIEDLLERAALMLFGGIIILIGLKNLFGPIVDKSAGESKKVTGDVTEAAGAVTAQPEVAAAGASASNAGMAEKRKAEQKEARRKVKLGASSAQQDQATELGNRARQRSAEYAISNGATPEQVKVAAQLWQST